MFLDLKKITYWGADYYLHLVPLCGYLRFTCRAAKLQSFKRLKVPSTQLCPHTNATWPYRIFLNPGTEDSLKLAFIYCKQTCDKLYIYRKKRNVMNTPSKCWLKKKKTVCGSLCWWRRVNTLKSHTFLTSWSSRSELMSSFDGTQHSRKQTKQESVWSTLKTAQTRKKEKNIKVPV